MHDLRLPLVSVIIPFLNEERFLGEAVDSVLSQSYTNWELILIDDGSSDRSPMLAQAYVRKYPSSIRYHTHAERANKGLSASRNEGIRLANGELIAFLDADDTWLPEKLSQQVSIFQNYPGIAMIAEASTYWYSWGNTGQNDVTIPIGAPQNQVFQPTELLQYLYPLSSGAAPCPSGLMVTRQAAQEVGGFEESFTKQYQLYEDQAFLHKIYLNEKVFVSSACQNKYRQRVGSIVQKVKSDGQYHHVRLYFLKWLEAYLQEHKLVDKTTYSFLQKALSPYRHPRLNYMTQTLPIKVMRFLRKRIKHFIP